MLFRSSLPGCSGSSWMCDAPGLEEATRNGEKTRAPAHAVTHLATPGTQIQIHLTDPRRLVLQIVRSCVGKTAPSDMRLLVPSGVSAWQQMNQGLLCTHNCGHVWGIPHTVPLPVQLDIPGDRLIRRRDDNVRRPVHIVVAVTVRFHRAATDRKSTRLNSSHSGESRMPSSA